VDAVQMLYSKKIGAVLAVEDGDIKGILTISDMLGLLAELLTGGNKTTSMSGD
jgi:predicted transcriptional regulator